MENSRRILSVGETSLSRGLTRYISSVPPKRLTDRALESVCLKSRYSDQFGDWKLERRLSIQYFVRNEDTTTVVGGAGPPLAADGSHSEHPGSSLLSVVSAKEPPCTKVTHVSPNGLSRLLCENRQRLKASLSSSSFSTTRVSLVFLADARRLPAARRREHARSGERGGPGSWKNRILLKGRIVSCATTYRSSPLSPRTRALALRNARWTLVSRVADSHLERGGLSLSLSLSRTFPSRVRDRRAVTSELARFLSLSLSPLCAVSRLAPTRRKNEKNRHRRSPPDARRAGPDDASDDSRVGEWVRTVSGFGRSRVFWKATDRASSLERSIFPKSGAENDRDVQK